MEVKSPAWLVECHLTDPELITAFESVIGQIPAEDHDAFPDVSVFEVSYTTYGGNVREESFNLVQIRLSPDQLKESTSGDPAALRGLIAHEVAHAFLRHHEYDDVGEAGLRREHDADDKAREWVGRDVGIFRERCGPARVHPDPIWE